MNKKQNKTMILSGSLLSAILMLSIPIVMNSFIQTMYNLTDTYWLGRIGTNPMAAITLVSPIQSIIIQFGQGITVAGSILISQYVGANDLKNAKIMANQLILCAMLFSLFSASFCFLLTPTFISLLGAEGEVFTLSKIYLQIVVMDMPFLFMINIFTAVYQSQGNTVYPMFLNLLGIILNMILDPLFMMVFHWGIAGAALATLISKVPCAILAFIILTRKNRTIFIDFSDMKPKKDIIKKIIRIGLPSAVGGSTMQFGFLLMTRNVYQYGSLSVAAYGIGNRINSLITMPANAMGAATSTIVGQNMGAGQIERAQKAYLLARRMTVIFLLLGGLLLSRQFVATPIVSIFSSDAQVISIGAEFLSILAICCWTNGIYTPTNGLFQGTGHTMITMMVDASRLWVFRFLVFYLLQDVFHMGVYSIWYSVVISNASSAFILWILYKTNIWRKDVVKIRGKKEII